MINGFEKETHELNECEAKTVNTSNAKNMIKIENVRTYEKSKKKTLVIAPHADDEVLGCFGYIDKEAKAGNIVDVIIMAVGSYESYGGTNTPAEDKIEEIKSVQAFIGVRNVTIFSDKESKLDTIPQSEIVAFFDEVLKEEYDTIFIPYPSRHIDHQVTYNTALASLRLKESKKPETEVYLYEYPFIQNFDNIQGGAVYLEMSIDDVQRKTTCFYKYKSQVKKLPSPLNQQGVSIFLAMRGIEAGLPYAEKYYLQTKIIFK